MPAPDPTRLEIGYWLSSEEHAARGLVRNAVRAEGSRCSQIAEGSSGRLTLSESPQRAGPARQREVGRCRSVQRRARTERIVLSADG